METLGYFCHNGHSLLSEDVFIDSHPAIKLIFESNGKQELVYLSAIKDKKQIKSDLFDKMNNIKVICSECKEELDNIAPCSCSKSSKFVAIYLTRSRSFNECVGLCSNCDKLYLNDTWAVISSLNQKN